MEKKKYSKPVVVAERFEPQEYCETCWYLDRSDAFTRLYHDIYRNTGFLQYHDGYYDSGENLQPQRPTTDFPANGSYKVSERPMPNNINDTHYYQGTVTEYHALGFIEVQKYTNHVTGPIYEFRNNGVTYYFDEIHTKGNAS